MRKIIIMILFILMTSVVSTYEIEAEEVSYPFDSIRIVSAFKFDISVSETPSETSFLYGLVELGETLTVYVGSLEFMNDGVVVSGSDSIMIVTNEDDEDLAAFLVNSFMTDLTTYARYDYGSWITIDPAYGVNKNLSGANYQISYQYHIDTESYEFIDNIGNIFPMVDASYELESEVDILVAAYTGGE